MLKGENFSATMLQIVLMSACSPLLKVVLSLSRVNGPLFEPLSPLKSR